MNESIQMEVRWGYWNENSIVAKIWQMKSDFYFGKYVCTYLVLTRI